MSIDRHVLAVEAEQTIATHEYAEPLCIHAVDGAPALWIKVDPSLPTTMRRVRLVQQSCGPVAAPEFGEPPDNLTFRYVGSCWMPAFCWHVFVEAV